MGKKVKYWGGPYFSFACIIAVQQQITAAAESGPDRPPPRITTRRTHLPDTSSRKDAAAPAAAPAAAAAAATPAAPATNPLNEAARKLKLKTDEHSRSTTTSGQSSSAPKRPASESTPPRDDGRRGSGADSRSGSTTRAPPEKAKPRNAESVQPKKKPESAPNAGLAAASSIRAEDRDGGSTPTVNSGVQDAAGGHGNRGGNAHDKGHRAADRTPIKKQASLTEAVDILVLIMGARS